jgi:hypothetical protein
MSMSPDGGGSGGGGGGNNGGAGGALVDGDSGSYSGSDGADLVPAGCTVTSATNAGDIASSGGNGAVVFSW